MNLSSQTKLLLIIAGILILVLFANNYRNNIPILNDGEVKYTAEQKQDIPYSESESRQPRAEEYVANKRKQEEYEHIDEEKLNRKFKTKNRAKEGEYKTSSYSEGARGNGPSDFDSFFDEGNDMVKDVYMNNGDFTGNDETGGKYANYKAGKKKKLTDEDIFRSEDYLPQDKNKDWFDVMSEPISIKNRHLINISRPIGVNTVVTSLKIANRDLRPAPACPKFVVSPFLNSTVEPDINQKGLC